ncbi:MAG: class I SAM-dependent methyltransferase [Clostridiales bacterium]|nr:class I SAM-dependent methyltransferase [Clostridiales bacterium]
MSHESEFNYFEKMAHWSFDEFGIHEESLTDWDLYALLGDLATKESRILDLGTGGGEKVLTEFPDCAEILGTDYSPKMVETARQNLAKSGKNNISFKVMDNLNMDVPDEHFDIVVARHTCTDPVQIYRCLKPGGHLLIRGVDKYDCWSLKLIFGGGQAFNDPVPVSITDYENVLNAGFSDVELVPIYTREFFKDRESFKSFLSVVPILMDIAIEGEPLDEDLLDEYIAKNTIGGQIILRRAYYGLSARKPSFN